MVDLAPDRNGSVQERQNVRAAPEGGCSWLVWFKELSWGF